MKKKKKGFGPLRGPQKSCRKPLGCAATQGFQAGVFGRRDDNSLMIKGSCRDTRLSPPFRGNDHCRDAVTGMTESLLFVSCICTHTALHVCFIGKLSFGATFFGRVGLNRAEGWGREVRAVACHVKGIHGCAGGTAVYPCRVLLKSKMPYISVVSTPHPPAPPNPRRKTPRTPKKKKRHEGAKGKKNACVELSMCFVCTWRAIPASALHSSQPSLCGGSIHIPNVTTCM